MKKQFKKSLSLFLAVLMMLSCWVWVAPEKAEAAGEKYYVEVVWNANRTGQTNAPADDNNDSGSCIGFFIKSKDSNGTGTEYSTTADLRGGTTSKDNTWSATVTGFPTSIVVVLDHGSAVQDAQLDIKAIRVGKNSSSELTTIFNGVITMNSSTKFKRFQYNYNGTTSTNDGDNARMTQDNTANWGLPKIQATAKLSNESITLDKVNTGNASQATIQFENLVDQYGVSWTGVVNPKFTLRAEGEVALTTQHAQIATGSNNNATITIKPWIQTLYPTKQSTKLYVDWNLRNGEKTGTETINIDFPTYNATFYANGGEISEDMYTVDTDGIIDITHDKMNIGSVIGEQPVYTHKENFEFMGFYSRQNDAALGKDTSFAGTKFENKVTKVPHTVGAAYGYDSDQSPFYGDTKWYAAWQAAPLDVTFITADNQLIATLTGRHNNYMTASNMYNGDAGLNAAIKAAYTGTAVKFNSNNEPIYKDGSTEYDFAGWRIVKSGDKNLMDKNEDTALTANVTFQAVYKKAGTEKYTVTFKDRDGSVLKDADGNQFTRDDYRYRDYVDVPYVEPAPLEQDAVYSYEFAGWANDIGTAYYTVDSENKDKDGAVITFIHKDGAEFIVKSNATYVPVYRMTKREYKVTYNYKVDGNVTESVTIDGYNWGDNPVMPEIKDNYTNAGKRYYITGWKDSSGSVRQFDEIFVEADTTITADYGRYEDAEYVINFYGKDVDGETDILLNAENNIYKHGSDVVVPEIPAEIDTAEALYKFKSWNPIIKTDTVKATGDRDYYAVYEKKVYADVYFYNYDGSIIYKVDGKEAQLFVGSAIPAFSNVVDGVETLPEKPEDEIGTYTFTEWRNSDGEKVNPGKGKLTGDLYLYAQFKTTYKEYEVKFVDNDGTVISSEEYHYGDEIVVPADPSDKEDVQYFYSFRAWSPEISEVCYGDAEYTATYRKTPKYYKVTWLDDTKSFYSDSNYQYNAKIQQALISEPVNYPDPQTGYTWAFSYWVQCDENGNDILDKDGKQIRFQRGMQMPAEALYFYPVFEEKATVLTVTFYKEDGTTYIGTANGVAYGTAMADIADTFKALAPKESDETYHYVINDWVNVNGGGKVETITENVSVKATYTAEEHNKQIFQVVSEPTCNVPGYAHYKCEADECTDINYNVAIPPVADESDPTGQIYVGSTKWTLEDFQHGIDYTALTYVGPKTALIVNAQDTGSRSMPWNLEGKLNRGVGKIEYNVSIENISNPATITYWTEIYNYEAARQDVLEDVLKKNKLTLVDYTGFNFGDVEAKMQKAAIDKEVDALLVNAKANATGVVSNLDLEDGETYVIYIKVTEREGNGEPNVTYFSSGRISYGEKAPSVSVTGEGYGAKFCNDAVIKVTDDTEGVKVYVDGEPITLEADGTCSYAVKGLHTIEAVDVHGNKTTKVFEIKGGHTFRTYTIAETCEADGSRYKICTDCGTKTDVEVLTKKGHSFSVLFVEKAPDCVNDGYRTYTCDNNCSTKISIKPTDKEGIIKNSLKLVEGKWVALTEEDLVAFEKATPIGNLMATGAHTYAMVKDEDGNDTAEYVWVIDKVANCKAEGSKHRDCTVCGKEEARVTEVIEKDNENGHNFYRVKVTLEPTCTEKGQKTKTCKYCGAVEFVEYVDALGHTAGEYRVITAATCEAKGSKILTCSECGVDIGEPIEDADGKITGFDGKAVEVKALGHAWNLDGEIYQDTDGKWYQNYKCGNDETHKDKKEVAGYKPPVSATVTFDYNGGYYSVPAVGNPNEFGYIPEMIKGTQSLSKFVGETIIETDIAKPIKAANATKTYTFSHWADAEGNEVKFPIEVKGDATYYAVFAEKYINYTITYYKEIEKVVDGKVTTELEEFKKTGYLHNGEEVTLAAGPSKAETNLVKYEFAGWKVVNSAPEVVYTDKVTIDGANINLVAKYNTVAKKYAVTYAYSSSNLIHTYTVTAGSPAPDVTKDFGDIVKDSDSKNHYTFKGWNKAAQLASVENDIYTTPEFESATHENNFTKNETPKVEATCTTKAVYTYTCTCGYTYDKEEGTVQGHFWGEPVYDAETGKTTVTCQNDGCGATEEDTRTFTVKFYINETDEKAIKTVSYLSWGTKLTAIQLPADPTKAETNENTYKFKGWAVKGTKDVVDVTSIAVKEDAEYVAIFEATVREYTVTFAYDAYNVIKVITGVKAGTSVTYSGATPTKAFDDNYHYSFKGWSGSTSNILKDTYVTAQFDRTAHDNTPSITAATCTAGEGTVYTCTCGYKSPVVATSKPLGHTYAEVIDTKVLPKDGKDGSVTMKCSRCGDTYVKVLPWTEDDTPTTPETPETPDKVTIRITVRDQHGNGVSGATVALYQNSNWVAQDITNSDGVVAFVVAPGKYTAVFAGVKYSGDEQTEITVNNDGSISGNIPQMYINNCGCACHRDNLWGKIFRFFHSIIKTLTGEFKCCKDPSDLY